MTAERIQNLVATPHKVEVRETEFPRQVRSQSGDWERVGKGGERSGTSDSVDDSPRFPCHLRCFIVVPSGPSPTLVVSPTSSLPSSRLVMPFSPKLVSLANLAILASRSQSPDW